MAQLYQIPTPQPVYNPEMHPYFWIDRRDVVALEEQDLIRLAFFLIIRQGDYDSFRWLSQYHHPEVSLELININGCNSQLAWCMNNWSNPRGIKVIID